MTTNHSGDRFAGAGMCYAPAHQLQQTEACCGEAPWRCVSIAALLALALAGPAAAKQLPDEPTLEQKAVAEAYEEFLQDMLKTNAAKGSNQACAIIIGRTGTMNINPEANEISSIGWGGQPGEAQIVATNGSFNLAMDAPFGFSLAPPSGNDATVFKGSYSGFGATNFSQTPGNAKISLKKGTTSITANLVATRTSGTFPAGQYRAELTLRCE